MQVVASADVDDRSVRNVRNDFAQHLVGEWSRIAFAEEQKSKDVRHGVPFLPFEINVRNTPSGALNMYEQSGNGV